MKVKTLNRMLDGSAVVTRTGRRELRAESRESGLGYRLDERRFESEAQAAALIRSKLPIAALRPSSHA